MACHSANDSVNHAKRNADYWVFAGIYRPVYLERFPRLLLSGWRLGQMTDYLRDNKLLAVGILPKRYAELESNSACVSSITVKPVGKE